MDGVAAVKLDIQFYVNIYFNLVDSFVQAIMRSARTRQIVVLKMPYVQKMKVSFARTGVALCHQISNVVSKASFQLS